MTRPKLGLFQGLRQEMLLQPRMLQSIEVLQLPTQDLLAWLQRQAEENEALVIVPPERPLSRAATDAHDELLQAHAARPAGLVEELMRQLDAAGHPADLDAWARFLVGQLDARGLLVATDEVLAALAVDAELPLSGTRGGATLLARAIAAVQDLEPRGVGARNGVEALLLQLDPNDPDYALLCRLLEDFLTELARGRADAVAEAMGLDSADLARLLGCLRELDLSPAADMEAPEAPLVPDLVVLPVAEEDGFRLELVRGELPEVHIDADVERLAKDRDTAVPDRKYLRGKLERARWIQDALRERGETLLRVAEAVFSRQRGFLAVGPRALSPLRMSDVADELGLATSTVSRAVAGKYVQTPHGVQPLRLFFQASASEDGAAPARDAVRDTLRDLVAAEDPSAPLSDDQLVERLNALGIAVARRTVAKYRKELGIASSYERRRA